MERPATPIPEHDPHAGFKARIDRAIAELEATVSAAELAGLDTVRYREHMADLAAGLGS